MPASTLLRAESRNLASLWPLLCSAVLVGIILASETVANTAREIASGGAGKRAPSAGPVVLTSLDFAQYERAHQPGRGRHAETPWQIPCEHLSMAAGILPEGAVDILREQIDRLAAKSDAKLSFAFIFGLAVALWSANAGMKAIMDALNVVYEEKEKRGFIKLNLVSLAFTLGAIGSLILAVGAVVILPIVLAHLGLQNVTDGLFRVARWPILLVVVIVGLAVLYRFGPSRRKPRWQWLSFGSIFAAAAWLISSALFSWYLTKFANYNATYGSLGAGIGMMMWMWVSSIVILFGAELNSEIEHQTMRNSTIHGDKPLGTRGAVMADTVGKAQ